VTQAITAHDGPALAARRVHRTSDSTRSKAISIISQGPTMPISKELLDILACPKCKGPIELNEAQDGLICEACRLVYEIRDGIPIMLIDEAKPLPK